MWTDDDAISIVGFDLLNAAAVIKRRAGLPIEPQQIVDHLAAAVIARIRRHVPWRPGARGCSTRSTPPACRARW